MDFSIIVPKSEIYRSFQDFIGRRWHTKFETENNITDGMDCRTLHMLTISPLFYQNSRSNNCLICLSKEPYYYEIILADDCFGDCYGAWPNL